MPPKMGLRVSSCFHNAFSAVDCQEISGRFWPLVAVSLVGEMAAPGQKRPTIISRIVVCSKWLQTTHSASQLGFNCRFVDRLS